MSKLTIFVAAVAALCFASIAHAEGVNLLECEQVNTTNPAGKRSPVLILLPTQGLPLDRVGIPRFIVEVHVSPEQVSLNDNDRNRVKEVQKCTYPLANGKRGTVAHVKLWALRMRNGEFPDHLWSAIELPAASIANKVLFRTKIGDTRYIGEWRTYKGHPFVLLAKH
jgi:hypothetical protein